MDETTSKFRVWIVPGKEPTWSATTIIQAEPFSSDGWTVVVRGDGRDLVRFIKSRRDLFTLYERVTPR
jgi:hypothetical protein